MSLSREAFERLVAIGTIDTAWTELGKKATNKEELNREVAKLQGYVDNVRALMVATRRLIAVIRSVQLTQERDVAHQKTMKALSEKKTSQAAARISSRKTFVAALARQKTLFGNWT